MKKILTLLFSATLIIFVLSACGNNASSEKHKVAGYSMYSVKVKSIKEDKDNHAFDVTGTTDAPDGSKIYAATPDSSYVTYGSNAATDIKDIDKWAKVSDGKFKVCVDPNNLYYGKYKTGQKVQAVIVAIKGFDQSVDSDYQFTKSRMKTIKSFATTSTFTITDEIRDYLNSIYEKTKDGSSDDSNSDSNNDDSSDTDSNSDDSDSTDLSSYNTGITYDQLARNPDQYKKKKVSFTGEVAQSLEQDGVTELRLAVDGDYDNIILVDIPNKALKGSRVLEDDLITVYGTSAGIVKYTSTSNEPISVPSMLAVSLDDKGKAPDDYGD